MTLRVIIPLAELASAIIGHGLFERLQKEHAHSWYAAFVARTFATATAVPLRWQFIWSRWSAMCLTDPVLQPVSMGNLFDGHLYTYQVKPTTILSVWWTSMLVPVHGLSCIMLHKAQWTVSAVAHLETRHPHLTVYPQSVTALMEGTVAGIVTVWRCATRAKVLITVTLSSMQRNSAIYTQTAIMISALKVGRG